MAKIENNKTIKVLQTTESQKLLCIDRRKHCCREREKGERERQRDREVVEEEEETDLIKTIIWGSEQLDSGDKKKELCALSSSHHHNAGRLFLYFYN